MTLTQPWAGLVASGLKLVENRPRSIVKREDFGKPFALHASREIKKPIYNRIAEIDPACDVRMLPADAPWPRLSHITKAVIAVATIERVVFDRTGRMARAIQRELGAQALWWNTDEFGYLLRDVRVLARPVRCGGKLGFWHLAEDVEAAVVEQLGAAS